MEDRDYSNDFNMLLRYTGGQAQLEDEKTIKINKLKHFPNHKFKLYYGERLENMIQSIKNFGVIVPIIVWENNNEFIILSGHNRVEVCKILSIEEIPCIIKRNLSLSEATLIVTETNLIQRSFSDLSHSERAYTLEQHYKAMKSQGKRNDLLQEIGKLMINDKTINKLSNMYNLSKNSIARYMRLAKLIEPLLNKIDENRLPIRVGYNLSFIENEEILLKINYYLDKSFKIDIVKSEELKKLYLQDILTVDNIENYIKNDTMQTKTKYMKLDTCIVEKYFNKNYKQEEIEETIDKALSFYFQSNNI